MLTAHLPGINNIHDAQSDMVSQVCTHIFNCRQIRVGGIEGLWNTKYSNPFCTSVRAGTRERIGR